MLSLGAHLASCTSRATGARLLTLTAIMTEDHGKALRLSVLPVVANSIVTARPVKVRLKVIATRPEYFPSIPLISRVHTWPVQPPSSAETGQPRLLSSISQGSARKKCLQSIVQTPFHVPNFKISTSGVMWRRQGLDAPYVSGRRVWW